MKYIDKFANLDDFLNSELQQMTGDRIATIEGFELPILKKKLKTVIDPSTNVEVEELQDVWMVPAGQEEEKVEHKYYALFMSEREGMRRTSFNDWNNLDDSFIYTEAQLPTIESETTVTSVYLYVSFTDWGKQREIKNIGGLSHNSDRKYYDNIATNSAFFDWRWSYKKFNVNISQFDNFTDTTQLRALAGGNTVNFTDDTSEKFALTLNAKKYAVNSMDTDVTWTLKVKQYDTNTEAWVDNAYTTEYDSSTNTLSVYVPSNNFGQVGFWLESNKDPNGDVDNYSNNELNITGNYIFSEVYDSSGNVLSGNNNNSSSTLSGLPSLSTLEDYYTIPYSSYTLRVKDKFYNIFRYTRDIAIPNIKLIYGDRTFEPLAIPSGTTTIDSMVLSSAYPDMNDRPTEFSIPEGVTRIEDGAFWGWRITNISFPSTLEYIGSTAFCLYDDQEGHITSVTLPANCKYYDNSFGGINNASFANMHTDPMTANYVWSPITVTGGQVYSCRLSDILTSEQKATLKSNGLYSNVWSMLDMNYYNTIAKITIADFDNIYDPANAEPAPYLYVSGAQSLFGSSFTKLKEVHFPTYMTGYLGDYVFQGCSCLTTVTGIDNITEIGQYCFANTNISSFTLPASVTTIKGNAFGWSNSGSAPLTSFTIPNGSMLTKIYGGAFSGQSNLASITLPVSCKYSASSFHSNTVITGGIQEWDPNDMSHFGQIVEDGATEVQSSKFLMDSTTFQYGVNYYFPSSVTTIGDFAFSSCSNLSQLTLHEGLTTIGSSAFSNMSSLSSISLPSTLSTLGSGAFWNSSQLSVTFPLSWSVTSIPENCFSGCSFSNSTSITIPSGTTSIGNNAFYNSSNLTSVTLPNSVTSIGSGAFAGTSITSVTLPTGCTWYETSFPAGCTVTADTAAMAVVADLTNYSASGSLSSDYFQMNCGYNSIYSKVIIPEGVTELQTMGSTWFPSSTATVIKEVTMPSTLTTVGTYAFQNMVNLETLDTQYLQSIPESLFRGDTKLFRNSAPTLNANVTNIGENAFRGTMKNVTTLDLSASNIMSIGANAFAETGLTSVTLPSGCTYYLGSFPAGCTVTGGSAFTYDETDVYNSCGVEIFPTGTTSVTSDPLMMYYDEKTKLTSLTVPASITTIGGFSWYNNLNTLTFQHTSSDPLYINSWAFQGDDIRSLSIPAGCTNIQESAFAGNQNLSSVTFDSNAVSLSIDKGAFANTALTAVTLPSVATYWPNSFPAGCTVTGGTIGEYPFYIDSMNSSMSYSYNSSWTKVYFQSDVTSTMSNQFEHAENIIEVEFNNSNSLIIQSNMFKDCEHLATATFNGAAVTISAGAFSGTALTAVTLPIGSTYEAGAFPVGCNVRVGISYLTFSASPEALGSTAIDDGETELSGTVTLDGNSLTWSQLSYDSTTGASVKYLDNGSYVTDSGVVVNVSYDSAVSKWKAEWYGCTGNRSYQIEIPFTYTNGGFTYTGSYFMTFTEPAGSVLITQNEPDRSADGQGYRADTTIIKVVVAEGVTSLGESAFNGCSNLVSVKLPSTLTRLGLGCFLGTNISSIVIPDGCHGNSDDPSNNSYNHLGYATFQGCTRLTYVYIPDNIVRIDSQCFAGCSSLTSIELPYGCGYETSSIPSTCTKTFRKAPSA